MASFVPPESVSLQEFNNIISRAAHDSSKKVILIKCKNIKELEGLSLSDSRLLKLKVNDEIGEMKDFSLVGDEQAGHRIDSFYQFISNQAESEDVLSSILNGANQAASKAYVKRKQPDGMKLQFEPLGAATEGTYLTETRKRYRSNDGKDSSASATAKKKIKSSTSAVGSPTTLAKEKKARSNKH